MDNIIALMITLCYLFFISMACVRHVDKNEHVKREFKKHGRFVDNNSFECFSLICMLTIAIVITISINLKHKAIFHCNYDAIEVILLIVGVSPLLVIAFLLIYVISRVIKNLLNSNNSSSERCASIDDLMNATVFIPAIIAECFFLTEIVNNK